MKKLSLLFIGLILPALVFVFLKFFGRNEFNVPPLHQEKIESNTGNCDVDYAVPYAVPDSVLLILSGSQKSSLLAVSTSADERHLKQVISNYAPEVNLLERNQFRQLERNEWIETCVLLMQDNISVALIDEDGNIRGYYDASDREELDRLDAEIKIILKKYEEL